MDEEFAIYFDLLVIAASSMSSRGGGHSLGPAIVGRGRGRARGAAAATSQQLHMSPGAARPKPPVPQTAGIENSWLIVVCKSTCDTIDTTVP